MSKSRVLMTLTCRLFMDQIRFSYSNCLPGLSQLSVVTSGDPKRRFEQLCYLIAIEHDVEKFSALVIELNQLDPARRLPVVSKQPPPRNILQN